MSKVTYEPEKDLIVGGLDKIGEREISPEDLIKGWNLVSHAMDDNLSQLKNTYPGEEFNKWTFRTSLRIHPEFPCFYTYEGASTPS